MHVIAKSALVAFWKKYPDAEGPLQVWHSLMEAEIYEDFNDLRRTFASADYVDRLTVFNIGGNKYRLIASIHYNRRKVYIRHVLTHAEYAATVGKGARNEPSRPHGLEPAGHSESLDPL